MARIGNGIMTSGIDPTRGAIDVSRLRQYGGFVLSVRRLGLQIFLFELHLYTPVDVKSDLVLLKIFLRPCLQYTAHLVSATAHLEDPAEP